MAEVTILDVKQSEPSELLAAHLDSPVTGTESDVLAVRLTGWALGRTSPVLRVEVLHTAGRVVREASDGERRYDVALRYPEVPEATASGFDVLLGVLGLPEEFELLVEAVLENGTRVFVGAIRGRHQSLRRSFEPSLQPILVTSLGRSGSTFLMRLLSEHPNVVVFPHHPYESSPGRDWMHLLGEYPFLNVDALDDPTLGKWVTRDYPESLTAFCQLSVEEWYAMLARRLGLERPRYFAEKHFPNDLALLTRLLYPGAKELFLVRDFRDTVCSIVAFNRKRGYASFGQAPGEADEEFIRRYAHTVELMSSAWRERSGSSHLVLYEDLVLRPEETFSEVLNYLELDASRKLAREIVARALETYDEYPAHRTTRDAEASIGRWRRDSNGWSKALLEEVFAEPLETFGYEKTVGAARTHT